MILNKTFCRPEIIAAGNDLLRQHHVSGEIVLSPKVQALEQMTRNLLLQLIADFDDFNPRTDPCQQRDFGSVELEGEYYYFLIENLVAEQQRILARIMRVMHVSEYSKSEDNMKSLSV